jgi:DNA polymerase-3 subunit epsilon
MTSDKILFVDTETGGLEADKNSLLSIALVVWQEFKIIATKEILINDGVLNVTDTALKINGINLINHKAIALSPREAIIQLEQFLLEHFSHDEKITLGGHNINFDVNFIRFFLNSNSYSFGKRFSHRYVDTATILYYLYLSGKIEQKAISSEEAFNLFNIKVENRHSALGDAIATTKLFSRLLKLIYKNAKIKNLDQENTPTLF